MQIPDVKAYDMDQLVSNEREYSNLLVQLRDTFNCRWSDAIHDSFDLYLRNTAQRSSDLLAVNDEVKRVLRLLSELESFLKDSEHLVEEAEQYEQIVS